MHPQERSRCDGFQRAPRRRRWCAVAIWTASAPAKIGLISSFGVATPPVTANEHRTGPRIVAYPPGDSTALEATVD
jgi:hypothetical protein